MIKNVKAIFNKDGSDYLSGNVDPFEYHKTFFFILKVFRVLNREQLLKPLMFNQNAVLVTFGTVCLVLLFISFSHGLSTYDINHMTETGIYIITVSYKLLILSCTKYNLPQYQNLLEAMKSDFFYICNTGGKYRDKYFQNQLITWKISILSCILVAMIAVNMVLLAVIPLIYYLTTNSDDMKQRPMPYPMWLYDVNISDSPVYEILFCFCSMCALFCGYNYIFMMQTQIVWIRHIASKADIVIWSIQDLLVDIHPTKNVEEKQYYWKLLQSRLREIVIHHQSMYSLLGSYAVVYKKLLMFEQKFYGPVVCLCAYCSVKKLEDGDVHYSLIIFCIGVIIIYFINSYWCTRLGIKVRSICDACWDIPFWTADTRIRPYMVLIMQRSLRPLPLQAAGFEEISLATFSRRMAAAYSSFNMLRQLNV